MVLTLKNPHSVLAAIETRSHEVTQVVIPGKGSHEGWERVAQLAKQKGISVVQSSPRPNKPSRGGGVLDPHRMSLAEASVKERMPVSLEELFRQDGGSQEHGLWIALDSLQDPHNVGAIFRAAAFFGVRGIVMTQERSAPLTSTVYDIASGGVERVPFSVQVNLQRVFEQAKERGLWVLGTSEHAHDDFRVIPRDRSWLLVLGNEEKGMRRLTEESCDLTCKISGVGKVTSLNVSVASGILISHFTQ